ncbi:MAG: T9SS type A sorting domain-containing protein, partial [Bacteroidetes bacterium]|nr:T9SS type A sorting domain-containing protein [Bacteroidota bacterium]
SEQNNIQTPISVFPNPTENIISLQSKNIEGNNSILSIMDISGRILLEKNVETPNGELNNNIDLRSFSSGIYFVQVKTEKAIYSVKVVRE